MKTVSRNRIVAFALLLVVALVAGFYTTGGKFSGLGSSYLYSPDFVCTEASLMSGEVRYNQSTADSERLMTEKTALEKQIKTGKDTIKRQETQVRQGEAQKKSVDKKIKTLDTYIDKNCSASALRSLQNSRNNSRFTERNITCEQKKNELSDTKQDASAIQTRIDGEKSVFTTLKNDMIDNENTLKSLGNQIRDIRDFVQDWKTCKRDLRRSNTTPIVTSMVMSSEVTVIGTVTSMVMSSEVTVIGVEKGEKSNFMLYDFSIKNTSQKKMSLKNIIFDIDGEILGDWYIAVKNDPEFVDCAFLKQSNQVICLENSTLGLKAGETKNYALGIIHKTIKEPFSVKVSFSSFSYGYGNEVPKPQGFSILGYNGITVNLVPATTALCGNTIVEPGEQCDDGNKREEDGCSNTCEVTVNLCILLPDQCAKLRCGDGIVDENLGEQCDDGNTSNDDGCDSTCKNVTIAPGSYVKILTPNGGETYDINDEISIKWASSPDVKKVMVGYSACESCLDWITNEGPILNTGSVQWKINHIPYSGAGLKIRIFGYSEIGQSQDLSDGTFTLKNNAIVCGNGIKEGTEQCDDGNTNGTDSCDNACKNTPKKATLANFDLIVSGKVFVNEPFTLTVKALDTSGKTITDYNGTIYFDSNNNSDDITKPFENGEYKFSPSDKGSHTFTNGFTIKKTGTHELVIFELDGPNGGINKAIRVVAVDKNTLPEAQQCTDSDGGLKPFISGHVTGILFPGNSDVTTQADICYQASLLLDNDVFQPQKGRLLESCAPGTLCYVKEWVCEGAQGYRDIPCPNGCSGGACRQWNQ